MAWDLKKGVEVSPARKCGRAGLMKAPVMEQAAPSLNPNSHLLF